MSVTVGIINITNYSDKLSRLIGINEESGNRPNQRIGVTGFFRADRADRQVCTFVLGILRFLSYPARSANCNRLFSSPKHHKRGQSG